MNATLPERPDVVDVVIVGLGPVGATLANLLGQRGISTLVLEREAAAYHLPRAVHFDDEVMRVFQAVGLADDLLAHVTLTPGMKFLDVDGRVILDWSRPATITMHGWHQSYRFHQPKLEKLLVEGLHRRPSVSIRRRCDVFALDQSDDGVVVRFEDLSNGKLASVAARYVVGCDGARSLVRRFIGSGLVDLGFHERWLVTDVLLKRPRPDLGDFSLQHCSPERSVTYVRGTGQRRRWEIALKEHERTEEMTTPARVWDLLSRWITPEDAELERYAVYMFHSVVAERWRAGRLLIAGDAAHQTPPFLGQGMCAGIRDAANLAWKLIRVLREDSGDALLDTYQQERAPHVREYIELAVKLGGIINTRSMHVELPNATHDDDVRRLRVKKPLLGRGFHEGCSGLIGQLMPQPRLSDGERLDDSVNDRFALLMSPADAARLSCEMRQQLSASNIAIVDDASSELQAWIKDSGHWAILVRPDRYVFGGANDADELQVLLSAAAPISPRSARR
jgi:3-(3-hydroxy-phenyl)propionate hydroxylase